MDVENGLSEDERKPAAVQTNDMGTSNGVALAATFNHSFGEQKRIDVGGDTRDSSHSMEERNGQHKKKSKKKKSDGGKGSKKKKKSKKKTSSSSLMMIDDTAIPNTPRIATSTNEVSRVETIIPSLSPDMDSVWGDEATQWDDEESNAIQTINQYHNTTSFRQSSNQRKAAGRATDPSVRSLALSLTSTTPVVPQYREGRDQPGQRPRSITPAAQPLRSTPHSTTSTTPVVPHSRGSLGPSIQRRASTAPTVPAKLHASRNPANQRTPSNTPPAAEAHQPLRSSSHSRSSSSTPPVTVAAAALLGQGSRRPSTQSTASTALTALSHESRGRLITGRVSPTLLSATPEQYGLSDVYGGVPKSDARFPEFVPSHEYFNEELPVVQSNHSMSCLPATEKPVRNNKKLRIITLTVVTIIIGTILGAVIGLVIYFTVVKGDNDTVTFDPTMSPSLAPTFISDEILLEAAQLSGVDALANYTSPQFRAVAWMSSVDQMDTGGFGNEAFAQRYAIIVMYFSFLGEEWINQEKWLTPTLHECEWSSGISCQSGGVNAQAIIAFDATRNNLRGTIPFEIGLLSSSDTFRIPKNSVGGTIPFSIGKMTSLSKVDVSDNQLVGAIPSSFEFVYDLITLDLADNQLTSTIPESLYTLPLLRTMSLTKNKLSGTLSEALQDLNNLITLDLSDNQMTGTIPVTLDSIAQLDVIILDHNRFSGPLPLVTTSLTSRQKISLSHNQFSGNIELHPDYATSVIFADFRLQYVDLSYNLLAGTINPLFGIFPSLRHFDLSGNDFVGTFPVGFGWTNIEFLAAANNSLTGLVPTGNPTLTHLDFSHNQLTEGVPEDFCNYSELRFLILSGNPLNSAIPSCFADAAKVRHLEIGDCGLLGPIPTALGQLSGLVILDLSQNSLRRSIPTELGDLTNLEHLKLQDNSLTGIIPSQLGNLVQLNALDLANNALGGRFPAELELLVELESLSLQGNAGIRGDIPVGLCASSMLDLHARDIGCNIVCDCCTDTEEVCEL